MSWKGATVLAVVFVLLISTTLVMTRESRETLLAKTPIGTSFKAVLAECTKRHWNCKQSRTAGYLDQDTGLRVGQHSIRATVRKSRMIFVFKSDTEANWAFDANDKLMDISINHVMTRP